MSDKVEDRFYLTDWKPDDSDGETRRLMLREGADDGEDVIMAEYSRYPAPLGDELALAALKAANAHAEANPATYGGEAIAKLRAMSDIEAVEASIMMASEVFALEGLPVRLLQYLKAAGFVRLTGPLPNHAGENRWEVGIRNIVNHLHGPYHSFEIYDIVDEVRVLAEGRKAAKPEAPKAEGKRAYDYVADPELKAPLGVELVAGAEMTLPPGMRIVSEEVDPEGWTPQVFASLSSPLKVMEAHHRLLKVTRDLARMGIKVRTGA